jgi:hypothetical protein
MGRLGTDEMDGTDETSTRRPELPIGQSLLVFNDVQQHAGSNRVVMLEYFAIELLPFADFEEHWARTAFEKFRIALLE